MIKEAKVRRAPRATKVTKEAKAPKGNPPLQCYMAARTRPKEARSKYPCHFYFTSIFTSSTLLPTPDTPSTTLLSFRPARSLVSSTCLLKGYPTGHSGPSATLPASTLLSPTFQRFPLVPLVPLYPVGHSGHLGLGALLSLLQVSHQSFHHFYLASTHFITFHHLSSHFITSHHIPSQSHLHSIHRLLTFHCLLHRFVSSWSFRPARYVLPHSYLPHTHTAPNGISLVIPAHQIPFTLHPSSLALPHRWYAFRSPFEL